ncbi:hypothetical protein [Novosphingobium sp.]|uniref:hypothetical protein n=1 Tax=Novosphingobium sp. TaxID=1874826 RepID=UPI001E199F29|nr:hypothetical protein [Novosphingobium sp.]MBX9664781.1 hypothetical protein [Novosphingobium sp.]
MPTDQIRLKASIRFLSTEEGGRTSPLSGGYSYRPNHNFFEPDDRNMCIGSIELEEGKLVLPGETIQTEITILFDPTKEPEFIVGREWYIQEGRKPVALGTILEVLSPFA